MKSRIDSAAPPSFDLRAWMVRFDDEAPARVGERVRIEFDLDDGPPHVSAEARELDDLFSNLALTIAIVAQPGGRLTIYLAPDDFESMPDEDEMIDPARWLHLAIEDKGSHSVGALFRRLLDPLINAVPQLASRGGSLRWEGRILFDDSDDRARIIHLLLPYGAERGRDH